MAPGFHLRYRGQPSCSAARSFCGVLNRQSRGVFWGPPLKEGAGGGICPRPRPPAWCRDAVLLREGMTLPGRVWLARGANAPGERWPQGRAPLPRHPGVPRPRDRLRHPPWHWGRGLWEHWAIGRGCLQVLASPQPPGAAARQGGKLVAQTAPKSWLALEAGTLGTPMSPRHWGQCRVGGRSPFSPA